ncbi:hypothetical protein RHSIM_Rhsim05G0214200 [Rhododendron simsii]|uniref:RING-type domain-containing protein n=1 Tax=Rhododendron simsii TaxID=118357 RepID=A0A834GXG3_RHOSS|nr:hypothetical protein RHSIM_Rhsim05G0214200 [Rhododendron simsii]
MNVGFAANVAMNGLNRTLSVAIPNPPFCKIENLNIAKSRPISEPALVTKRREVESEGIADPTVAFFLLMKIQRLIEVDEKASDYPHEYDGACLQMRLSYSPCARIFLFLVRWSDCNLAGALGFLRILIYKAYDDGKTTISLRERKASIRDFYGVIFPSLLQLQRGITDVEDIKQRELCAAKYQRREEVDKGKLSEIEIEREEECGICLEVNSKVVFPKCNHSMCMKCYRNWRARSQSCPFCRDSLKRVNSGDLWICTSSCDYVDLTSITKENLKRLMMYIEKLPLVVPDPMLMAYDPRYR